MFLSLTLAGGTTWFPLTASLGRRLTRSKSCVKSFFSTACTATPSATRPLTPASPSCRSWHPCGTSIWLLPCAGGRRRTFLRKWPNSAHPRPRTLPTLRRHFASSMALQSAGTSKSIGTAAKARLLASPTNSRLCGVANPSAESAWCEIPQHRAQWTRCFPL